MIINHTYKFIFIKTLKTAGTSLEIALSGFCGPDDVITPIGEADEILRQALGFRGPQNYQFRGIYQPNQTPRSFFLQQERKEFYNHATAQFIRAHTSEHIWSSYFKFCFERNPFDKAISLYYFLVAKNPKLPSNITDCLQATSVEHLSNWYRYTINEQIAVDFVGRYECLHEDLEKIRQKLKIDQKISLPWAKGNFRQDRRHYSEVLSPENRVLISTICAKEIRHFNYGWNAL